MQMVWMQLWYIIWGSWSLLASVIMTRAQGTGVRTNVPGPIWFTWITWITSITRGLSPFACALRGALCRTRERRDSVKSVSVFLQDRTDSVKSVWGVPNIWKFAMFFLGSGTDSVKSVFVCLRGRTDSVKLVLVFSRVHRSFPEGRCYSKRCENIWSWKPSFE